MGFEIQRFLGDVDEEFICPICSGVLEDPLQVPACEHAFCRDCISEWISLQPTCPVDRQAVTVSQLRPVPRIIRNVLSRLRTSCDNAPHGCNAVLQLDSLASHLVECEFNPKRPMPCEAGCGLVIPKDELAAHNCVRELRALIATQLNEHKQELAELKRAHQGKLNDHKQELAELKRAHQGKLNDHKQELNNYKQEIAELKRAHQGKLNDYEQELAELKREHKRELALLKERQEVVCWAKSLARARVTSWVSRIPEPKDTMRIKRSLLESGCPPHIIDDLVKNCHAKWWPPGLGYSHEINSLKSPFERFQTTSINSRLYEKYVCKKVPGQQAVVILHCDNTHMGEDMIVKPGFVVNFQHGFGSSDQTYIQIEKP